ncbi:protein FAM83C [Carcharodon carcharias]|uniref:protein FAM83C n=1 Tax=Carcharodon carcharias TaxID=13397 RepID=UPI001B7F6FB9|nr:protein FAM83C [Carcharodon carcharias]
MSADENYDVHPLHKLSSRKPLGKLARRLEEVKNPWRRRSVLELSHSEAARLATDALLESGLPAYKRALAEEREPGFLSGLEIAYITRGGAARPPQPPTEPPTEPRPGSGGDARSELTSVTYFPMQSDSEAPLLDLGWSKPQRRLSLPSETHIIFRRDKSQSIKDTIRRRLSKAKSLIAIVMDLFTDVDIFCDLLEASSKRGVPVYLLLDESNLEHFMLMCDELDIQKEHIINMRIRSVKGDTYCTKSGKKFHGQVLEKFMIIDLEQVLAGSYSFTWLAGQVHLNFITLSTGQVVQAFDDEFRCLYAESKPIERFSCSTDEVLSYYTSNLRILPEHCNMKERLVEPIHSNTSSSQSGSSPRSVIELTVPAVKIFWEGKQISPCASNGSSDIDYKIKENDKSSNNRTPSPLGRLSGLGFYSANPSNVQAVHYPHNFCLQNQGAAVQQRRFPIVPPRTTQIPKDDLPNARKPTPPSLPPPWVPSSQRINRADAPRQAEEPDDPTKDLRKAPGGMTRSANRMTLGHSKLEMMVEYNDKMKARSVYSRFQLMKHGP